MFAMVAFFRIAEGTRSRNEKQAVDGLLFRMCV